MRYTEEQLDFLRENRTLPRLELMREFNARFGTNATLSMIVGLLKRKRWLCSRITRFVKGHIPWCAGKKGLGICKPNKGSFRKGHRPCNWRPVGSERVNKDGYIEIKVREPRTWRSKHVVVWESAHGQTKKGDVIRFKDNNKLNCRLDNLEMVSRQVNFHLNRNGYTNTPEVLKPAMMSVARLEVKVFELKRKSMKGV